MITEPTSLFALLAAILAVVFWLSQTRLLSKLFTYLPPVIWAYFVPMLLTTAGITPATSATYDWMTGYLLPIALFLLMLTADVKAIARLGKLALIMMVAGTSGIVLGGPISYALFGGFLEPEAWKGFAGLAGSWIGGTANMVAVTESIDTPPSILGPAIVIDTVVGYGWMGVLLFLSPFQKRFDNWVGADTTAIEDTNRHLAELNQERRPSDLIDFAKIVGLAFGISVLSIVLGGRLPSLGDPTIISQTTWTVLIVVTLGLGLSFTPFRKLEHAGASRFGYLALYLLLTGIGAQADLKAVIDTPVYFLAGAVWIAIHVGILFLVARLIKAPLFFVATGSMANIGGAASAPVVAGVYHPAMAPIGLIMAVAGYILGIYAAFFCAYLISLLAVM